MMTYEAFRTQALAYALTLGCAAAETVFVEGDNLLVDVLQQEIDSYSVSRAFGIGLRVQIDGKDGYAYTEKLEEPEALCLRAVDNARSVESGDTHPMQGPQSYAEVFVPLDPICDLTGREKIDLALRMEREALGTDPRIKRVSHSRIATGNSTVHITNTLGLDARRTSRHSYAYLAPIAQEGDEVRDGYAFRSGKAVLDISSLVQEAVEETVSQFGAVPVPSGRYRILLRNWALMDFFSAFIPMFSAENAQKGLSPLANRESEKIASDLVTIIDDPLYAGNPRAFDDEGTASISKTVIKDGVFETLLHNLKTAKKAGVSSTSNANRPSAGAPIRVAPTNFCLQPGTDSFEALCRRLGDGLIITEVSGLHAGANPVTGDFSLLSKGFLVENGKILRPVDQVTIAGSFLTMLGDIEAVGSDLKFSLPGSTMLGMPSVLVSGLMVAGV